MLSFFPLDVLDEIWDVIESVSEGFRIHSCDFRPLYACEYSDLRYTIAIIGGNDLRFTLSHAPAAPKNTAGVCAMCSILIMDVTILFPRQTRVYMLLREGLLILGILSQT